MTVINKEALISQFNDLCVGECCCCRYSTTTESGCKVIDDAPEVEPTKHGHWLFYEEPDGYYHSECSECGQWCDEDVFLKGKWHYCPNCGAKMSEVTG